MRREEGFVSLELVLGLALLVLPVALLVLMLPTWVSRQNLARLAAQQGARAAVVSESAEQGAVAAKAAVAGAGHDPGKDLALTFEPASSFAPGGLVTLDVTIDAPVLAIPFLGTAGSFGVTARFSERVDPYRSAR